MAAERRVLEPEELEELDADSSPDHGRFVRGGLPTAFATAQDSASKFTAALAPAPANLFWMRAEAAIRERHRFASGAPSTLKVSQRSGERFRFRDFTEPVVVATGASRRVRVARVPPSIAL